jgi:hypothetical protein
MASQLQKSSSLVEQNQQLLAALREVSTDLAFNARRHPVVMNLLSKVCPFLSWAHDKFRVLLTSG